MVNCTAFASVHYDLRLALFKFVTLAKQVLHRMKGRSEKIELTVAHLFSIAQAA